jgi:hypothetical protein
VTERPFRIAQGQAPMARSIQALMIGNNELRGFVYRGPFQLSDTDQREALLYLLNTEFDTTVELPSIPPPRRARKKDPTPKADQIGSLIAYLVIVDGKPVLFYDEDDVVSAVFGFVLGRYGIEAARRVTFREGMLPPPPAPAS